MIFIKVESLGKLTKYLPDYIFAKAINAEQIWPYQQSMDWKNIYYKECKSRAEK